MVVKNASVNRFYPPRLIIFVVVYFSLDIININYLLYVFELALLSMFVYLSKLSSLCVEVSSSS